MKHLHERMDDLFANGNTWKHRTLRTIFDPHSAEWNWTSLEEKVAILKKIKAAGEKLEWIALEYDQFYRHDMNRADIADDLQLGLIQLMTHLLG